MNNIKIFDELIVDNCDILDCLLWELDLNLQDNKYNRDKLIFLVGVLGKENCNMALSNSAEKCSEIFDLCYRYDFIKPKRIPAESKKELGDIYDSDNIEGRMKKIQKLLEITYVRNFGLTRDYCMVFDYNSRYKINDNSINSETERKELDNEINKKHNLEIRNFLYALKFSKCPDEQYTLESVYRGCKEYIHNNISESEETKERIDKFRKEIIRLYETPKIKKSEKRNKFDVIWSQRKSRLHIRKIVDVDKFKDNQYKHYTNTIEKLNKLYGVEKYRI